MPAQSKRKPEDMVKVKICPLCKAASMIIKEGPFEDFWHFGCHHAAGKVFQIMLKAWIQVQRAEQAREKVGKRTKAVKRAARSHRRTSGSTGY